MPMCDNVYGAQVCVGDMETNSILYRDIVIDAPIPLKNIPTKPRLLLITHGHADHFRYAYEYRDHNILVAAPRHCIPLIENPAINQMATIGWAGPVEDKIITRYFIGKGVRVDKLLEPGQLCRDITALAAPGHTPGHLVYLISVKGAVLLAAGDTVLGYSYLDKTPLPYHTSTVWLVGTLSRLRSLDIDVLVPGHGETAIGKKEAYNLVDKNLAKINDMLRLVEKTLPGPREDPVYVDEVVARVAEELGYTRSKRAYSILSPTIRALLLALKYWSRAEALPYKGVLAWRRKQ